jgi:hypothetical protein
VNDVSVEDKKGNATNFGCKLARSQRVSLAEINQKERNTEGEVYTRVVSSRKNDNGLQYPWVLHNNAIYYTGNNRMRVLCYLHILPLLFSFMTFLF